MSTKIKLYESPSGDFSIYEETLEKPLGRTKNGKAFYYPVYIYTEKPDGTEVKLSCPDELSALLVERLGGSS